MDFEVINEPVEVLASFRQTSRGTATVRPEVIRWRSRDLRLTEIGLRHPTMKGRRMLHRFTFTINDTAYEIEFDAEQLTWQLTRLARLS
jgi:hypothetical protein